MVNIEKPLMTDEEHRAMELSATLWNYINRHVVIAGHTRDSDLREIMFHIHGIQRALLGQAAARAYPDKYRLLGGQIAGEGEEMPAAPWTTNDLMERALDAFRMYGNDPDEVKSNTSAMNFPMVHKDGRYPWANVDSLRAEAMDAVEKTFREQSENRRTDEEQQNFAATREVWTDGQEAFDRRFPTIEAFKQRFGEDSLTTESNTDELLDHSCSCHVNGNDCGLCKYLSCPIALVKGAAKKQSEDRRTDEVSHILTLVTNQPICMTPRSAIGFVKAVSSDVDTHLCKKCLAASDELGFRTMEE